MSHHVLYIPGIGDQRSYGQPIGIQLWRLFGLTPHYFPLGWANAEGFEAKQTRLLAKIDELAQQGHRVSLVGISAGASAALAALAARPKTVAAVVCIVGKIQHPETVKAAIYQNNPDFKESMSLVAANLQRIGELGRTGDILSLYPFKDTVVPPADTVVEGAISKRVLGWSHVTGALFGGTLGAPIIARFIRSPDRLPDSKNI